MSIDQRLLQDLPEAHSTLACIKIIVIHINASRIRTSFIMKGVANGRVNGVVSGDKNRKRRWPSALAPCGLVPVPAGRTF